MCVCILNDRGSFILFQYSIIRIFTEKKETHQRCVSTEKLLSPPLGEKQRGPLILSPVSLSKNPKSYKHKAKQTLQFRLILRNEILPIHN